MIRKITGSLDRVEPTAIELAVGNIVHEVLVPEMVRRQLQPKLGKDISLYTFYHCTRSNRVATAPTPAPIL